MISIIVAVANNGIIGGENNLLWHIREDLQHFKRITTGHPIIMGRKTFESLGRPLPNRTNVVITRQPNYSTPGCVVVHSLDEAIKLFSPQEEIFIIGGGEIYKQAWNKADKFYITWINAHYKGDVSLSYTLVAQHLKKWKEVSRQPYERGEEFPFPFEFITYERRSTDDQDSQESLFT